LFLILIHTFETKQKRMMKLSTGGCFWEISSPEWLRFMNEGVSLSTSGSITNLFFFCTMKIKTSPVFEREIKKKIEQAFDSTRTTRIRNLTHKTPNYFFLIFFSSSISFFYRIRRRIFHPIAIHGTFHTVTLLYCLFRFRIRC
jgi:hypothetical protein